MRSEPAGLARVVMLLAGVSVRRFWNRIASRRQRKHAGPRTGTARKGTRSAVVAVVFLGLMLFNSVNIATGFARGLSAELAEQHHLEDEPAATERHPGPFPTADLWLPGEAGRDMVAAFGLLLAGLMCALFLLGLSSGNQELAQAGWSMEWLFTFPVSTRGLFLARIGEYAATNILGWLVAGPLLFVMLVGAGKGWIAVPLAALGAAYFNALIGAARAVVETILRKRLSLARLKNVQALCTVLGIASFFAVFTFAVSTGDNGAFVSLARSTPTAALAQPLSAPALLAHGMVGFAAMAACGLAFIWVALRVCEAFVRDGLIVVAGGPVRGERRAARAEDWDGPRRAHGLLGKELLLLRRDRSFLVQTLVVPLLFVAFYGITASRGVTEAWGSSTRAVVAFVVGGYVLMFGGFSILATELKALWLLFTLPRPMHRILKAKVLLWAAVSSCYVTGVLLLLWRPDGETGVAGWLSPFMALGGAWIFAFLAGGLGVLGTDPHAVELKRHVRPEWMYLYMLLLAVFAHGVASDQLHVKLGMTVFVGVLAVALWDRVGDSLPLLLDPTQAPRPRLTLTDGIVAGLVFLELTQLGHLLFAGTDWPAGARVVAAYASSGLLSVLLALYTLRRLGWPGIRDAVGWRRGTWGGMALAAAGGAAVAGVALIYLAIGGRFEGLREAIEESRRAAAQWDPSMRWSMAALAVILAPLFEEIIFRGMIFRAMRQRMPVLLSVLASAALFALVHPPVSWLPVFLMGTVAALVLERTGSLWAAVCVHMTYNAIVVAARI